MNSFPVVCYLCIALTKQESQGERNSWVCDQAAEDCMPMHTLRMFGFEVGGYTREDFTATFIAEINFLFCFFWGWFFFPPVEFTCM